MTGLQGGLIGGGQLGVDNGGAGPSVLNREHIGCEIWPFDVLLEGWQ